MHFLSKSLATPQLNLALDEALLEAAESGEGPSEVLRVWESPQDAVILGRASKFRSEVCWDACQRDGIPVLRRSSGGATVMIGPGCLMYSVVLGYERHPHLRQLDQAHQFVMSRLQQALEQIGCATEFQGTCDLTIDNRKISGNSLRCKRDHLLYHGTLLIDFDLDKLTRYLGTPSRQPDYREQRSHRDFVAAIDVDSRKVERALRDVWSADRELPQLPQELTEQLVIDKYSRDDWNLRL